MKKFDIYKYAEPEKGFYEILKGVFHDETEKVAVSSNGYIVVTSKLDYNPEFAGLVIAKSGDEIPQVNNRGDKRSYPNWKSVILRGKTSMVRFPTDSFYKSLKGIETHAKSNGVDLKQVEKEARETAISDGCNAMQVEHRAKEAVKSAKKQMRTKKQMEQVEISIGENLFRLASAILLCEAAKHVGANEILVTDSLFFSCENGEGRTTRLYKHEDENPLYEVEKWN